MFHPLLQNLVGVGLIDSAGAQGSSDTMLAVVPVVPVGDRLFSVVHDCTTH